MERLTSSATVKEHIYDLSTQGLAFYTSPNAEQTLGFVTEVKVSFRFPGDPDVLCFRTWIRHRTLHEEHRVYGLSFDGDSTDLFKEKRRKIATFLNANRSSKAARP